MVQLNQLKAKSATNKFIITQQLTSFCFPYSHHREREENYSLDVKHENRSNVVIHTRAHTLRKPKTTYFSSSRDLVAEDFALDVAQISVKRHRLKIHKYIKTQNLK